MNTGTEIKKRSLLLVEILSQEKLEKAVKFMENLSLKINQKQQLYSPKSEKKINKNY